MESLPLIKKLTKIGHRMRMPIFFTIFSHILILSLYAETQYSDPKVVIPEADTFVETVVDQPSANVEPYTPVFYNPTADSIYISEKSDVKKETISSPAFMNDSKPNNLDQQSKTKKVEKIDEEKNIAIKENISAPIYISNSAVTDSSTEFKEVKRTDPTKMISTDHAKSLTKKSYSIQYYTSKQKAPAQRYLENSSLDELFIYKTKGDYYTVRSGHFNTVRETRKYCQNENIEPCPIVTTQQSFTTSQTKSNNDEIFIVTDTEDVKSKIVEDTMTPALINSTQKNNSDEQPYTPVFYDPTVPSHINKNSNPIIETTTFEESTSSVQPRLSISLNDQEKETHKLKVDASNMLATPNSTTPHAKSYSIQYYTSMQKGPAQRYINSASQDALFIYKTKNDYYTVRKGYFNTVQETRKYCETENIEPCYVVKTMHSSIASTEKARSKDIVFTAEKNAIEPVDKEKKPLSYPAVTMDKTTHYKNTYSIQHYTSKPAEPAKRYLKNSSMKDLFLYQTNSGYHTVRSGIFHTKSEANSYCRQKNLNQCYIVPTNPNKIGLAYEKIDTPVKKVQTTQLKTVPKRKETLLSKEIEAHLTPCRTQSAVVEVPEERSEPWELPIQAVHVSEAESIRLAQIDTAFNYSTTRLEYYVDIYASYIQGMQSKDQSRIEGGKEILKAGIKYRADIGETWDFYTDLRVNLSHQSVDNESRTNLWPEVRQLYFASDRLLDSLPGFGLLIGRREIRDVRAWWYSNSLDMAELFYDTTELKAKFLIGGRIVDERLTDDETTINLEDTLYLIGHLDYQYYRNNRIELFGMHEKNDKPQNQIGLISDIWKPAQAKSSLTWLGARATGYLANESSELRYWLDVGYVTGETQDLFNVQYSKSYDSVTIGFQDYDVSGWGGSLGGVWRPKSDAYALGAGLAAGDGEKSSRTDTARKRYIQPRIANNKSHIIGPTTFRYYGELVDPELTNIMIASLYGGINVYNYAWLQMSLHNYRQIEADTQLYASRYMIQPNGHSEDIGNELDIMYNYRLLNNSQLQLILSAFKGGSAFDDVAIEKDGYRATFNYRYYWQ